MKRLSALFLVLVLLLCGCRTVNPETTTQATTQATTEAATEAPTEPASTKPTAPVIHFPQKSLQVHFIDVGQADCILLECDNAFALVDAGYPENGAQVVSYLQEQGVQRLNLVVGTHHHGDHIGGLPEVLKAFPADNIWSPEILFTNSYVSDFRNAAKKQGKELVMPEVGQQYHLGGAVITVLGPLRMDYEDTNDTSIVLMVEYGNTRFLLTGDMEREAELELVNSGADLKADVLKVGHHGSYSSTSYLFLRTVAPTYAVISVGRANEYGHPHDDPMSRLRDADVTIFRTDKMYTVLAVSDGENIQFTWGNRYAKPWTPAA